MVIAGTGHRPSGLTSNKSLMYTNVLTNALADFYTFYLRKLQPAAVISGMALGSDMGLAVAALRVGIPLVSAIPHYYQEAKWGKASQDLYDRILGRAAWVVYIELGEYAAWKEQSRNQWMVDRLKRPGDLVLALWSGKTGGTANTVAYAEKQNKRIMNLWAAWETYRSQHKL